MTRLIRHHHPADSPRAYHALWTPYSSRRCSSPIGATTDHLYSSHVMYLSARNNALRRPTKHVTSLFPSLLSRIGFDLSEPYLYRNRLVFRFRLGYIFSIDRSDCIIASHVEVKGPVHSTHRHRHTSCRSVLTFVQKPMKNVLWRK